MDHLYNQIKHATMTTTNTNQTPNAKSVSQVSASIINNNGTVNVARYMDLTPSQTENEELVRLLDHAEQNHQQKQARNTEKDTSMEPTNPYVTSNKGTLQHSNASESYTSFFRTGNGSPILHNDYGVVVGQNKKPYQIPYASSKGSSVVTPQSRKTDSTDTTTTDEATTTHSHHNEMTQHIYAKDLSYYKSHGIYHSTLLDKEFKPSNESLELSPELEPLRQVILSQHEGFTQLIKDLGHINISLTKIIEKKKDSLQQITKHNKIPRSLHIKCELTTSAAYTDNPTFLTLKAELQDKVSVFIQEGSEIMARWTEMNIQLLINDRCVDILSKALQILDGLIIFHTEILGVPTWPSVSIEHNTLFLLKLYLSNRLIDTSDISKYLKLPPKDILIIGAKILTRAPSDDEASTLINALNLSDININNAHQHTFISETLLNFDQILRTTTVDIWSAHTGKLKQSLAALNLKARLQSLSTIEATDATAAAVNRAIDNINKANHLNLNTNLRLANLERNLKRQEQRHNETFNNLKKRKTQKNLNGSHSTEPMASPDKTVLKKPAATILDLTGDNPLDNAIQQRKTHSVHQINPNKYQRRKGRTPESTKKSVQWKEDEVENFSPNSPAATTPQLFTHQTYAMPIANHTNIPFQFTQVPPAPHLQNTFSTPMYFPMQFGQHNQLLPQQITPQQYFPGQQLQPPNPFQRLTQKQNISTRENPFGVRHPTNKN